MSTSLKNDAAASVFARQHADREENQEQRHADPVRKRAGEDRYHQQRCANQDKSVDVGHAGLYRSNWLALR